MRRATVIFGPNIGMLYNLNDDVLQYLLSFISPRDAMQLMQTCHAGYWYAMPRFLSEVFLGRAVADGPKEVKSFCAFMLADAPNRIRHLRSLELFDKAFRTLSKDIQDDCLSYKGNYSCAGLLVDVLEHAIRLQCITIHQPDPLFTAQPMFMHALAALPRLDKIHFFHGGEPVLRFVSLLTSRPRELHLCMTIDHFLAPENKPRNFMALNHLSGSLQTLTLWNSVNMTASLPSGVVWPCVQTLSLGGSVALDKLLPAFPNLRVLYFRKCHFTRESSTFRSWPKLDEVTAIYPAPLSGPVRRLTLEYNFAASVGSSMMLERTSPVVLSCFVGYTPLESQIVDALQELKFLRLHVLWNRAGQANSDSLDWLMIWVDAFKSIPLVGLSLRIGAGVLDATKPLDPLSLAGAIFAGNPSLRHVGIAVHQRHRDGLDNVPVYTWYRRVPADAVGELTLRLEEITESEGSAVERQLLSADRS